MSEEKQPTAIEGAIADLAGAKRRLASAALEVFAAEYRLAELTGDPFPGEPESTDPARDLANHREGARLARERMGEQ